MGPLEILALIKTGTEVAKEVYALFVHRDEATGAVTKVQLVQILDQGDVLALEIQKKIDAANAQQ